jgi:hypothetical protein
MPKNQPQPSLAQQPVPDAPTATRERFVTLSAIEQQLVDVAVGENRAAVQAANTALAQRLAPIRNAHNLVDGIMAEFRPKKDGSGVVMVVHEPVKKKGAR